MPSQGYWYFCCPECGFSDEELGHLLGDHELYCIVCLEEADGPLVRLQRWLVVEGDDNQPQASGGFVA
jgi:hypothetical protein